MNTIRKWKQIERDGKSEIKVWCPNCERAAVIDHEIADDGRVTPSLDCPFGCGFHASDCYLEDWQK